MRGWDWVRVFQNYLKKLRDNTGMDSLNQRQKTVVKVTFFASIILFLLMFIFHWPIYFGIVAIAVHLTAFRFFK